MTAKKQINAIEFTEFDAADLQKTNWLAKDCYRYKKLCYDAVKTPLVKTFGTFDGYDLQVFERKNWDCDYDDFHDWFSTHCHILERYVLGGKTFHQPTNEFYYYDARDHEKKSARYDELRALCGDPLIGIAKPPDGYVRAEAIRAVRRLVHKFFPVVRTATLKKMRLEYPFFQPVFDGLRKHSGWRIRVPNEVAVCSSCGGKMILNFDTDDVKWFMEDRGLGLYRIIRCDGTIDVNYENSCEFARRGFRERNSELWTLERQKIFTWLPTVLPKIVVRDLRLIDEKYFENLKRRTF